MSQSVYIVEEHGWEHGAVIAVYAEELHAKRHAAIGRKRNWSVEAYELREEYDADRAIAEARR